MNDKTSFPEAILSGAPDTSHQVVYVTPFKSPDTLSGMSYKTARRHVIFDQMNALSINK